MFQQLQEAARRAFSVIAVLILVAAVSPAQQPNTPMASLTVNGTSVGPYPMPIFVPSPGTLTLTVSGMPGFPGLPYALYYGTVAGPGLALPPYGILDLSTAFPIVPLFDGFGPGGFLYQLDPATGSSTITISVPSGLVGPVGALQAIVSTPGPPGVMLSAAAILVAGPSSGTISVGSGGGVEIPISFTFPFYGTPRSSVWVNEDGILTFGGPMYPGGVMSFPENTAEFLAGPAKIAPLWHDLSAAASVGGTTPSITWSSTATALTITYLNTPEIFNLPPLLPVLTNHRQSFRVTLASNGTITFDYAFSGENAIRTNRALVGISPGAGLSSALPVDLSLSAPAAFPAMAAVHERFGGTTYGGGGGGSQVVGRFDLRQRTVTFVPDLAGTSYTLSQSPAPLRLEWVPVQMPSSLEVVTVRGSGFAPGATVNYRSSGGGGIFTPFTTFFISSEELLFVGFSTAGLSNDTMFDLQVSQAGGSVIWPRAMSLSTGTGPLLLGTSGTTADSVAFTMPFLFTFFQFTFPGNGSFYVNPHGNISFGAPTASIDTAWTGFLGVRQIAGARCRLVPGSGTVIYSSSTTGAQHVRVAWRAVPEWPDAGSNSFGISIFPSGIIDIDTFRVTAEESSTGIAAGTNIGLGLDLSAAIGSYTSPSPFLGIHQSFTYGTPFDLNATRIRFSPTNGPTNTLYSVLP